MDGWHAFTNFLYVFTTILFIVLIYFIINNRTYLYDGFNIDKYVKKFSVQADKSVVNGNADLLKSLLSDFDVSVDSDGNIAAELSELVAYICYLLATESLEEGFSSFQDRFNGLENDQSTYTALYPLFPVAINCKDFVMNNTYTSVIVDILTNALKTVVNDKNPNAWYILSAYICAYEYKINDVDLSSQFSTAVSVLNNVTISDSSVGVQGNLQAYYPIGNLAINTMYEFEEIAKYLPHLYIANKYKKAFNLTTFDNLVAAHSLLAPTFRACLLRECGLYTPQLSNMPNLMNYSSINCAMMIQSMYKIFSKKEVEEMLARQHVFKRVTPIESMTVIPKMVPIGEGVVDKPYCNVLRQFCSIPMEGFKFTAAILKNTQQKVDLFLSMPMQGDTLLDKLQLTATNSTDDETTDTSQINTDNPFFYMRSDTWTTTGSVVQYPFGNNIVGMRKLGDTIGTLGSQDFYYVSDKNSLAACHLFSNVSIDASTQKYILYSFQSQSIPEIVTAKDSLTRLENVKTDTSNTISWSVEADRPFNLRISVFNTIYSYSIWCDNKVTISCTETDDSTWLLIQLMCDTTTSVMVQKDTASLEYLSVSSTIIANCAYLPKYTPKLIVGSTQNEKNSIKYFDINGVNTFNLFNGSLNLNIINNLITTPILDANQRNYLLIIDNGNPLNTGTMIYDATKFTMNIFQNKTVKVENGIGISKGFNIKLVQ